MLRSRSPKEIGDHGGRIYGSLDVVDAQRGSGDRVRFTAGKPHHARLFSEHLHRVADSDSEEDGEARYRIVYDCIIKCFNV